MLKISEFSKNHNIISNYTYLMLLNCQLETNNYLDPEHAKKINSNPTGFRSTTLDVA